MSLSCRPEAFFFFPKKNKKHKHKQKQKQKQKNIKKKTQNFMVSLPLILIREIGMNEK